MAKYFTVREGRAYIHQHCGTSTIVRGKDFARLCNPFGLCLGTVCAQCGPDSTKKFTWEDTGESVSGFRRRIRRASSLLTIWNWIIAPVIGAVIGGLGILAIKAQNVNPTIATALGATAGAVAMALFIAPFITGLFAGSRFYDQQ